MNRKTIVLTRLVAVVLLIGMAAAGCANSGSSASGSTSPTSTAPSSQSASAISTPIDSAAPNANGVTGPTSTAEATNAPAPTANGMTGPTSTAKATNAPAPTANGVTGPTSTVKATNAPGPTANALTGASAAPAAVLASVDLGTAGNYVLLSKAGISTTGTTKVTGSIAVSPIAASALTGFGLVLDRSGAFSRSTLVTGNVYAANYAAPTPSVLTTAVKDMQTAYTNAAGRTAGVTELAAGNIGGLTLAPGVYKWGTGVTIPTNVTLSGGKNDVWIFQIAGTLSTSSATKVILAGGAQCKNIFWQVAGATTLGTYSTFNGNILDKKNIALRTGAVLNGRALAQTAITLQANKIN